MNAATQTSTKKVIFQVADRPDGDPAADYTVIYDDVVEAVYDIGLGNAAQQELLMVAAQRLTAQVTGAMFEPAEAKLQIMREGAQIYADLLQGFCDYGEVRDEEGDAQLYRRGFLGKENLRYLVTVMVRG